MKGGNVAEIGGAVAGSELLDTYKQREGAQVDAGSDDEDEIREFKRESRKRRAGKIAARIAVFDERRGARMRSCCAIRFRDRCKCGKKTTETTWRCMDRFCPICAPVRSARLASKWSGILPDYRAGRWSGGVERFPYHLVLTWKNSETLPSRAEMARCFKQLRARKFWKQYGGIVGGFYSVEVTLNAVTGQWHAHIHALIFTLEPIPVYGDKRKWHKDFNQQIADAWQEITEDSFIVHGTEFDGRVEEMTKYLSKGSEIEKLPDSKFEELVKWSKGAKLFNVFGELRGIAPDENDEDEDTGGVCECGECERERVMEEFDERLRCYVPVRVGRYNAKTRKTLWENLEDFDVGKSVEKLLSG